MSKELCPCGSKKQYSYCCGMYLSGKKKPETAEKLMRSRYTVFSQSNVDYLIATLHPKKRKPGDLQELTKSINNTQWLGLTIINTQKGKKNDVTGYVEFEAIYQLNEPGQLHERSRFIKTDGQWFYPSSVIFRELNYNRKSYCWL